MLFRQGCRCMCCTVNVLNCPESQQQLPSGCAPLYHYSLQQRGQPKLAMLVALGWGAPSHGLGTFVPKGFWMVVSDLNL